MLGVGYQRAVVGVVQKAISVRVCCAAVDDIRTELKAQLTSPVAWTDSVNYMLGQGVKTFVEVGAGDVLLSLVKRINRKTGRIKFKIEANGNE